MSKSLKKIAILGSAPSSVHLAPFSDTSWEIWGCSPGCYPLAKRADRWFEIHRWEPGAPWFSVEYIRWMANLGKPVMMIQPVEEIPNSVPYPIDDVVNYVYAHIVDRDGVWREKHFDPSDFSSTIAWMLALAIMEGATDIGLWGVDMSAQEEWFFQRSGCQSLIDAGKSVGIRFHVPLESDIMRPPPMYGFCEASPEHIKYIARKNELHNRLNAAAVTGGNLQREVDHLRGALDQLEYNSKTWIGNPLHLSIDGHRVVDPRTLTFTGEDGPSEPPPAPRPDGDWRALETELEMSPGLSESMKAPVSVPSSTLAELDAAMFGSMGGALQANVLAGG